MTLYHQHSESQNTEEQRAEQDAGRKLFVLAQLFHAFHQVRLHTVQKIIQAQLVKTLVMRDKILRQNLLSKRQAAHAKTQICHCCLLIKISLQSSVLLHIPPVGT